MYFRQWRDILAGRKTQTRRLCKDNEFWSDGHCDAVISELSNGDIRLKWEIGRTYAVSPGRGKRAIWWHRMPNGRVRVQQDIDDDSCDWQQMRIELTNIRVEWLQQISEADALAEGAFPNKITVVYHNGDETYSTGARAVYAELWDSLSPKGLRWRYNPKVWVLEFQLVE